MARNQQDRFVGVSVRCYKPDGAAKVGLSEANVPVVAYQAHCRSYQHRPGRQQPEPAPLAGTLLPEGRRRLPPEDRQGQGSQYQVTGVELGGNQENRAGEHQGRRTQRQRAQATTRGPDCQPED